MTDTFDTAGAVDAYLGETQGDPGVAAQMNVVLAQGTNPDYEAELQRASGRLGIPIESARNYPDEVKAQAAVADSGLRDLYAEFPSTARLLGNINNARVAHDDISALKGVEQAVRSATPVLRASSGPEASAGTTALGLLKSLPQGLELTRQGLRYQFADLFGFDEMRLDAQRKSAAAQTGVVLSTPSFESRTGAGVYSGASSFVRQIPAAIASIATRSTVPLLSTIGIQTEAEAYAKYRVRGADPAMAALGAVGEGVTEVGTEMLPMGFLVSKFGKAGAGQFLAGLVAREVPTEQVATLVQDAIDTAIENPGKTWAQYAQERPDAAYQTLVATVTQAGIAGSINAVAVRMAKTDAAVQDGLAGAADLERLSKVVEASKLRARAPDTFASLVADATENGPVENVYLSADALMQSGMSDEVAKLSPSVAEQLPVAAGAGGDIRIPLSEYATALAGKFDQQLLDHLKFDPNGFSRAEANDYMSTQGEALKAEFERVLSDKEKAAAASASKEAVKTLVMKQLELTNHFDKTVNDAYASLVGNFYGVTAAKMGITPESLWNKLPLKITAMGLDGPVLDQGAAIVPGSATDNKSIGNRIPLQNDIQGFVTAPTRLVATTPGSMDFAVLQFDSGVFAVEYRPQWGAKVKAFHVIGTNPEELLARAEARVSRSEKAKIKAEKKKWDSSLIGTLTSQYGDVFHSFKSARSKSEYIIHDPSGTKIRISDHNLPISYEQPDIDLRFGQSKESMLEAIRRELGEPDTSPSGPIDVLGKNSMKQGERGAYSPSTNTIALLENADLSTFLHEIGHFFLETTAALASLPNSPAELRNDMQTMLQWFGVKSIDEWNALDFEVRRGYHEQFARGFEAYLFEGKSPSIEAQSLFQRFRAWLMHVYRDISALGVSLSDEVRGVMDRMIASSEQIADAELARNMIPLFQTPAEAGMTQEEFRAYHASAMESTQDAIAQLQLRGLRDMKWLANAKAKELKRLQREANEARRAIRDEVTTEIMNTPLYRTWAFLTAKRGDNRGKLLRSSLEDIFGSVPGFARLDELGMTSDDGLPPDIVAALNGFESGDEMLRELMTAPEPKDAISARTDELMLERHSDLSTPAELAYAVDEALHTPARVRFAQTEYNALAKATGQPALIAEAAKSIAFDVIARLRIRDVKPSQYAAAASKAAAAAQKALRSGDISLAAVQKRNQTLNLALTQAAYDARASVMAGVSYLRRFRKASLRTKIDASYNDQIDKILERVEIRAITNREADQRATLADWIEARRADGFEPDIPQSLLNEATRTPIKSMTVEEFSGVVDTVKMIEHLGRAAKEQKLFAGRATYQAARDELVAGIAANAGGRNVDVRFPVTMMERAGASATEFWVSHLKAAQIARIMDGDVDNGPVWRHFIRTANEHADAETAMKHLATRKLIEIIKPLGQMSGRKKYYPAIKMSLNTEQVFAMALNTGNAQNVQRLLDGEGWTQAQLDSVLQSLGREHWTAVQQIWDFIESYRPQIAAIERSIYGVEPKWVQALPAVRILSDGSQIAMRGGYYPIKYDPSASMRAEQHADAEVGEQLKRAGYTAATTRHSFTKARAEEVKNRPILYSLSALYSGVDEVIHDISWRQWVIDTSKLLRSQSIDDAIRSTYGPEWKRQMKKWVTDIASGNSAAYHPIERAIGVVRHGIAAAGLGFNVMSAAVQVLGYSQSIVRIGPKYAAVGLMRFMASPLSTSREINAKSSFMMERARTRFRELNELRNVVQGKNTLRQIIERHSYTLMIAAQRMVDIPTWQGGYKKAIAEGSDESTAIALADQAVKDSQGSGLQADLSAVERGGPFVKLFSTFYTFMNTALNLGVVKTMTANTPAKKAKLAADYLLLYILPPALGFALKAAITPGDSGSDDPERLWRELAKEQMSYLFGLMIGVRELSAVADVVTGKPPDYSGPTGLRAVSDTVKLSQQAVQLEFDDAFRKALINTAGDLFGLPAAQVNRSITGMQALSSGETENPAAVVFGYQKPH